MKHRLFNWYTRVFKKNNWLINIKTNVKKYNDHLVIQLNAPGRHLDDFTVKFDHDVLDLVITAQSIESSHEEDYLRHEFYLRGFVKTFYFGFDCQDSEIETKYLNGILYIKVTVGDKINRI